MRSVHLAVLAAAALLFGAPAPQSAASPAARAVKPRPSEVQALLGDQTGAGTDADTFLLRGTAGARVTLSIAPAKGVRPKGTVEVRIATVGGPADDIKPYVGKPKRRGRFRFLADGDYEIRVAQTGTRPFSGGYVLQAMTTPAPTARLRPQADVEGVLPVRTRNGGVHMPAGSLVAPESCKVLDWMGEVTPSADGAFAIDTFDGEPTVAVVTSPSGAPMLFGWVGADWGDLSARTTADYLLYMSVLGPLVPGDGREKLRRAIAAMPEVQPLANQIAASLAADADAMGKPNPAVEQALRDLVHDLLPPETGKLRSLLVEPSEARSGLRLNTDRGINSIYFRQSYRRRAHAFVDRVAYVPADGDTPVRLAKPVRKASFGIDPVGGVKDAVGAFSDIVSAVGAGTEMPYEEKDVPGTPVPLSFEPPDAREVIYRIVTVGAGTGIGDYESDVITKEHRTKHDVVTLQALILDIALPMIVAWFGTEPGGDMLKLREEAIGGFVADAISIFSTAAPNAVAKARAGDMDGALRELLNAFFTSNTLQEEFIFACFEAKILSYSRKSGVPVDEAIGKSLALSKVVRQCANGLNWANAAITAFDTLAIGTCIAKSNAADVWTVTVLPPKVSIVPESSEVDQGGDVKLRCVVQDLSGSGVHVEYRWAHTAKHGHIEDGFPGHRDTFTGSSDTVTYTSDGKSKGTDTVTVKVYQFSGASQSGRTYMGKAQATVEVGEGKSYRLQGDPSGSGIAVDDGLDVYLNGSLVYTDGNRTAGVRPPIPLSAQPGDTIRLVVRDTYGYCASLSRVVLRLPNGKTVEVDAGFNLGCGRPTGNQGVVRDTTFTIPKTGK